MGGDDGGRTTPASDRAFVNLRALAVKEAKTALFLIRLLDDPPQFQDSEDYTAIRRALVRGVLSHASLCSRVIFPGAGGRDEQLAARIRKSLGAGNDSLLKDRAIRDSFEHVDERLEVWAESASLDEPLTDWYTPGMKVAYPSDVGRHMFQAYFGDRIVTVGRDGSSEEVSIASLRDELERIANAT